MVVEAGVLAEGLAVSSAGTQSDTRDDVQVIATHSRPQATASGKAARSCTLLRSSEWSSTGKTDAKDTLKLGLLVVLVLVVARPRSDRHRDERNEGKHHATISYAPTHKHTHFPV